MWVETDQPDWNAVWGDDGAAYTWVDLPSYEPPPAEPEPEQFDSSSEPQPEPQPEQFDPYAGGDPVYDFGGDAPSEQPPPEPVASVVDFSWFDIFTPSAPAEQQTDSEPAPQPVVESVSNDEPAPEPELTPANPVDDYYNDYGDYGAEDYGGSAQLAPGQSYDPYAGNDWVTDFGGDAPVYDPYADLGYSSGLGGDANTERIVEDNGDVYESYDGGVTWDYLGNGVQLQSSSLQTYYDPDTGDTYESYDGGVTWDYTGHQATIDEIQNATANAFGTLPTNSSWQPIDTPFPNRSGGAGSGLSAGSGGGGSSGGSSGGQQTNQNGTVPTNGNVKAATQNPTGNVGVNPLTLLGTLLGTGLAIAKKGQTATTGGSTLQLTAGQNGGAISRTSAPVSNATRSPASLTAATAQKKAAGAQTGSTQTTLLTIGGLVLAAKLLA